MQTINIFLGSSFRLMNYRIKLGETARILNEKWLQKGVRVHLFKWEDFRSEYRGKSKQEEYIDEMVLNSEICMFLFSDSIGKFTKLELEAKLKQNRDAVYTYRVKTVDPENKRKDKKDDAYCGTDEIENELNKLCGSFTDLEDETAAAKELTKLVEEYIEKNNWTNEEIPPTHALYFYTTIPDDNAGLRDEFGDTFRHLDDFFYETQAVRCILHDREKINLLAKTDHYVPLMKNNLSDSDYQELETAVSIVNKQTDRLKSLTFFKNGEIHLNVPRVRDLLDNHGIYPVSYENQDTLKSKIKEWIMLENKRILDLSAYVNTATQSIQMSNKVATPFSYFDTDASISRKADKANKILTNIEDALKIGDNQKIIKLQSEYSNINRQIIHQLNKHLNDWAFHKAKVLDTDQKEIEIKIKKLNTILTGKLSVPSNKIQFNEVLDIFQQIEDLTRELIWMGYALPHRLLAVQMNEVGIYDTYLGKFKHQKEEDALYKRIIDDADRFGLLEPVAEMMRMNYANCLSRDRQIEDAAQYYKQAISNLKRVSNKSKIVWHNITDVYMHLCNLYADSSMHEELDSTYAEFKEHVMNLDFEEYCLDYCMLAALEVKIVPKYEKDHEDKVHNAMKGFDYAMQELNLPINHQNYGDVFVFLPNWIAAYFVDHCEDFSSEEHKKSYLEKAEKYALTSLQNAEELIKVNYRIGLFSIGEALHQLGFIAAYSNSAQKALEFYDHALNIRRILFDFTNEPDMEPRIAQTLVNKGAVLLESRYSVPEQEQIDRLNDALKCAEKAKEIYKRHIEPDKEMTECNYYEALQLEGTIYYAFWQITPSIPMFNKAKECLKECWEWNIRHPRNHYQDVFEDVSGKILKIHELI